MTKAVEVKWMDENGDLWFLQDLLTYEGKPLLLFVDNNDIKKKLISPDQLCDNQSPCVCKGNWASIIEEVDQLIGRQFALFTKKDVSKWTLKGVLWAQDDFYYEMIGDGVTKYVSCCFSLSALGYVLIEQIEYEQNEE